MAEKKTRKPRRTKAQIEADKAAAVADAADKQNDAHADMMDEESAQLPEVEGSESHDTIGKALLAAQREVVGVQKDKMHAKFKEYASAENILRYARAIMHKHGLLVRGGARDIWYSDEKQPHMTSKFTVTHAESGEEFEDSFDLPMVTHSEKGNPIRNIDDAALVATTVSWGYYLRDVLAMPRLKDGDDGEAKGVVQHFTEPKPLSAADTAVPSGSVKPDPVANINDGNVTVLQPKREVSMTDEMLEILKGRIGLTGASMDWILNKYEVSELGLLNKIQYEHLTQILTTQMEAKGIADKWAGASVKVTHTEPPTEGNGMATNLVLPSDINLIRQSLECFHEKTGKDEKGLLLTFGVDALSQLPKADLNKVMAWCRP